MLDVAIQRREGEFATLNQYLAWQGFRALAARVLHFESATLDALSDDPALIIVGGIPMVHRRLDRLGFPRPTLPDLPPELAAFTLRETGCTTMGEVRRRVAGGEALFLKPMPHDPKLFGGHVAERFGDLIRTAPLSDDHPVQISAPVQFVAEFRAFVRRRTVVAWQPYRGQPGVMPDFQVALACLDAWIDPPAACSVDVGLLADGRSALIEVNDGFALGAYGMHPVVYAQMIGDRWAELVGAPLPAW